MYKLAAFCLCAFLLMGCNKKPESIDSDTTQLSEIQLIQQQKDALIEEFSGVWAEGNYLFTIYHDGKDIHFIVDEDAKEVRLGDVDLDNETINLLVRKVDDNQQGIITLRRNWVDEDKKSFTLTYTSFDGENGELSFVRRIGNDDKTRIENIYTNQFNNTYEDPSTPAYDVASDEEYYVDEDLVEADRIATEAANSAEMAAYEAQIAAEEAVAAADAISDSY